MASQDFLTRLEATLASLCFETTEQKLITYAAFIRAKLHLPQLAFAQKQIEGLLYSSILRKGCSIIAPASDIIQVKTAALINIQLQAEFTSIDPEADQFFVQVAYPNNTREVYAVNNSDLISLQDSKYLYQALLGLQKIQWRTDTRTSIAIVQDLQHSGAAGDVQSSLLRLTSPPTLVEEENAPRGTQSAVIQYCAKELTLKFSSGL